MQVQQQNVDNIANNLANASTVGFKRTRLEFQDLMYQNMRSAGAAANASTPLPVGLQIGMGARSIASEKIFTQGEYKQTQNPLDMMVEGSGFFQVRLASGEIAYTRAGQFHLNEQGQIVTAGGEQLEPSITIPTEATSVTIAKDGTGSTTTQGQPNAQNVGQIQLAIFANPAGLEAMGANLFKATGASGQATVGAANANGIGAINQGFIENSNVSVVEELVNMISAQRIYETNSKVITTADRMLGTINQAVS
jgi:flagellar basal-body rod protein FlgG